MPKMLHKILLDHRYVLTLTVSMNELYGEDSSEFPLVTQTLISLNLAQDPRQDDVIRRRADLRTRMN